MSPTLLLIGSGPGIGLAVSTLFASKKFSKVALLSRDSDRLSTDRSTLLSSLPSSLPNQAEVKTWAVDITDTKKYREILADVEKWAGDGGVDCVVFNAARVAPSPVLEFSEDEMVKDFMVFLSFPDPFIPIPPYLSSLPLFP